MVQVPQQPETFSTELCLSTAGTQPQNVNYPLICDSGKAVIVSLKGWLHTAEMTYDDFVNQYNMLTNSEELGTVDVMAATQPCLDFDLLKSWNEQFAETLNAPLDSVIKILVGTNVNQPMFRWSSMRGSRNDFTEYWEEDPILAPTLPDADRARSGELSPSYSDVIERAKSLEEQGHVDSAIDLVLDSLDELFRRGQFALCDSILFETDVDSCSTDILVTLLTATARARSDLAVRSEFVQRTKQALESRGDLRPGVLDGLE